MSKLVQLIQSIFVDRTIKGWEAADALLATPEFRELGGEIICDETGRPEAVSLNLPRRLGGGN